MEGKKEAGSLSRQSISALLSSQGLRDGEGRSECYPLILEGQAPLLPEVEVGEGCEIPQGWVQTSQAVVVEAQAFQGYQLACCLRHLRKPVPGQV